MEKQHRPKSYTQVIHRKRTSREIKKFCPKAHQPVVVPQAMITNQLKNKTKIGIAETWAMDMGCG
jgi:hypothetical protein